MANISTIVNNIVSDSGVDITAKQNVLSGTGIVKSSAGVISYINGIPSNIVLGDGSLYNFPLNITSPSSGQVLKYDGTNWVNASDAGITGSGAAGQVAYFTGATTQSGSNNLFWDNTNARLGVGTNVPTSKLHVTSTAWNSTDPFVSFVNLDPQGVDSNGLYLQAGAATSGAYIANFVDYIGTSAFYVRGDRNVGIGTTSPAGRLEVNGLTFINNTADTTARLLLRNSTTGASAGGLDIREIGVDTSINNASNGNMYFSTNNSERVRIFAGGNVSIGSTSDNGLRFQVTGDGFFSGYVTATSFIPSGATIPTNGMYLPAANTIGFATNSAVRMRIDGSGNVLISSGTGAALPTTQTGVNIFGGTSVIDTQAGVLTIGANNNAVTQNSAIGILQFYSNDASTNGAGVRANIQAIADNSNGTAYALTFGTGLAADATEKMRLTSAGNLGVGITTPTARVEAVGVSGTTLIRATGADSNGNADVEIRSTGTTGASRLFFGDTAATSGSIIYNHASDAMLFSTAATTRATLDASGNLGLGVTPSAWAAGYKALQVLNLSLFGTSSLDLNLGSNVYYDGVSYKYIANGFASLYNQYLGKHYWNTAASGTAGNAITFTQAMTLDASGNLLVGQTSNPYTQANRTVIGLNGTTDSLISMSIGGTAAAYLFASSTSLDINANSRPLTFSTTGAEKARIFNNGNFAIGTTTDAGFRLDVNGTMRVSGASTFNGAATFNASTIYNSGSVIRSDNGTAAAPAISFDSDLDTGIYRISANTLGIATGGVAQFTIASTGAATFSSSVSAGGNITLTTNNTYIYGKDNVGNIPRLLGINSGNSTYIGPIDVYAGGEIFYGVSANVTGQRFYTGATERMRLTTTNGNLHIGTFVSDSGETLQVNGTMKVSGASTFGASSNLSLNQNAGTFFRVQNTTSGTGSYSELIVQSDASSGSGSLGKVSSAYTAYKLLTAGSTYIYNGTAGNIAIQNDFATGSIVMAAGGSSTAQFTIASTGAATFSSSVTVIGNLLGDGTTNTYYQIAQGNFNHRFFTRTNVGAALERFTIEGGAVSGKAYFQNTDLGIGTNTPSYKLDVTGEARVSNAIAIGTTPDVLFPLKVGSLMTVSSTGNVGINQTNPTSKLHVVGTTYLLGNVTTEGTQRIINSNNLRFTKFSIDSTAFGDIWFSSTTDSLQISSATNSIKIGGGGPTTFTEYIGIASGGATTFVSTATAASFIPTSSTAPSNGIYLPAANSVAISTNSTNRLSVSSLGVVKIANLSGSGTAIVITDNAGNLSTQPTSTYLSSLSGEATNSGSVVTLTNSAVIGKVLTGLNVYSASIASTDSILTAFGKIQGQIDGLQGGTIYKGSWNANTNTPTITSSTGTQGNYYVVTTAGTTTIDGVSSWAVGDWIIFNGTVWEKIPNVDAITSVNGQTGVVSLTTTNINEGTNLYYTDTRARAAISLTTSGSSGAATYSSGVLNIPTYTLTGLGGAAAATTITINGTAQDLSANRTFNVGTVTSIVAGSYLTGGTITSSGTIAVDATTTNTASKIVARDASGNFSAGTITATLSGTASNATTLGGLSLQSAGSAPGASQVLRTDTNGYSFFGYINSNTGNSENPSISQIIVTNGSDNYYRKASLAHLTSAVQGAASGSWGINITGNAATASAWQTARTITIGSTGKSVDGSGNVSWSLGEIGAQAALTNPVTGTGASGQVAFWNGTTSQTGTNNLFWDNTNARLGIATSTPAYTLDVTGQARVSDAIAIGTTPDTNYPFRILKNINSTVGIRFENTSTGANSFMGVQFGTDVTGGTAFTNMVYASSGTIANGVYNPSGTSIINTGSGGLNFLGNPIRMYTGGSNGVLRWDMQNDGISQFTSDIPTTNVTDGYRQYSADVVAGNAAPHFRTENGGIIKLYQQTTGVGNSIFSQGGGNSVLDDSTFDGYTLRQIVKALRNSGLLA